MLKKEQIIYLFIILFAGIVAYPTSATTYTGKITDCPSNSICIVDTSETISTTDGEFRFESLRVESGVELTVDADNGCGYPGGNSIGAESYNADGSGGAGGGCFIVHADSIIVDGIINAKGQNGFEEGGGGGSGGEVHLYADDITVTGTINVDGGNGANARMPMCGDAGGGGAGGRVLLAGTTINLIGEISEDGGAGGWGQSGCSANPGESSGGSGGSSYSGGGTCGPPYGGGGGGLGGSGESCYGCCCPGGPEGSTGGSSSSTIDFSVWIDNDIALADLIYVIQTA